MEDTNEIAQIAQLGERFLEAARRFEVMAMRDPPPRGDNTATIHVNAGGLGLWAAVTCAVVCGALTVVLAAGFLFLAFKYDRMQDYLNAIYAQAPHLRPKEEK